MSVCARSIAARLLVAACFVDSAAAADPPLADLVARFESSGLTDRKVLFDAYRVGAADPLLRARLASWYGTCSSYAIQLDIDTLLDQLGEPHECLPRWPDDEAWIALPFAGDPPLDPAMITLDQVERGDGTTAQRALVALVVGRSRAEDAARAAVLRAYDDFVKHPFANESGQLAQPTWRGDLSEPSGSALAWLGDFAPSVLAAACETELRARRDDPAFVKFALRIADLPLMLDLIHVPPSPFLIELARARNDIGNIARQAVAAIEWHGTPGSERHDASSHDDFHPCGMWENDAHWEDNVNVARWTNANATYEAIYGDFVDNVLAMDPPRVHATRAAILPCRFSSLLREHVEKRLLPFLDDPSALGDEAAFVLAHVGMRDAKLRARFVRVVDAIAAVDDRTWEHVPCLAEHDDATRAALRRLAMRSPNSTRLLEALTHAGLLDDPAALFGVEHWGSFDYAQLRRAGLRVRLEFELDDSPEVAIQKVAIAWNAPGVSDADRAELRRRFETAALAIPGDREISSSEWTDIATEFGFRSKALVDRAVELAVDVNSFSDPQSAMCQYLCTCELDPEQQWKLCSLESIFGEFDPAVLAVFARQGAAALPRIPRLRKLMTSTDADLGFPRGPVALRQRSLRQEIFATILAIARPSRDDISMLAQAIRFGLFEDRLFAARTIERLRIDTAEIRAALVDARDDLEPLVRGAAAAAEQALGA